MGENWPKMGKSVENPILGQSLSNFSNYSAISLPFRRWAQNPFFSHFVFHFGPEARNGSAPAQLDHKIWGNRSPDKTRTTVWKIPYQAPWHLIPRSGSERGVFWERGFLKGPHCLEMSEFLESRLSKELQSPPSRTCPSAPDWEGSVAPPDSLDSRVSRGPKSCEKLSEVEDSS